MSCHLRTARVRSLVKQVADRFRLSQREEEVLAGGACGNCTKETAAELGLSMKTIEYFWSRIYAKLNCHSQAQVLAMLLRDVLDHETFEVDPRGVRKGIAKLLA